MRIGKFVASGVSIVAVAGCLITAAVTPDGALAASVPAYEPGQLLVGFKSNADSGDRGAVRRRHRAKLLRGLPVKGLQLVKLPAGISVKAGAKSFERSSDVRYAVPNAIYDYASTIPNDPKFPQQWGLNNTGQALGPAVPGGTPDADIDAPEAWDTTVGSPSNTVAMVDSGIDYNHPDLAPNIWKNPGESGGGKETNGVDDDANGFVDDWRGWDFTSNDNDPRDLLGHGTATAGAAGARGNDGVGIAGVTWNTKLMALRVQNTASLIAAFEYASANGAKVVNASVDCRAGGESCGQTALKATIAAAPNTLFVVAAGNRSSNNDVFPAWPCDIDEPNLICVGASDYKDNAATLSNYGTRNVDLTAPGVTVVDDSPVWSPIYQEGFEDDISSSWTSGGTNNAWARTSEQAASGSFALSDSPGGDYLPDTLSFIQKNDPIDLSGRSGCQLGVAIKAVFPSGPRKHLSAQVSTDGSNWTTAVNVSKTTPGPGFGGDVGDISSFDGQNIFVRFLLQGTGPAVADGAYVDNLRISCLGSDYTGTNGYALADGTSIAAPQVSGAAALLFADNPSVSAGSVKTALLRTVDVKTGLTKFASGGRLNVWRALHYSPPPVPTLSATAPVSGSDNNAPKIKGTAQSGTTVYVYAVSDCSGAPIATGSASTFNGSGIGIGVADNSTTTIRARAFTDSGGMSACSSTSATYKEVTKTQKFESTIAGAGKSALIRGKALHYGSAGLRVDRNAGWSVSATGQKLAVSSANSASVGFPPATVQPGGCPVAAFGKSTLKPLAFYHYLPDNPTDICAGGGTGASFGSMSVDNRGRQIAFSANFPFDSDVEATADAPQVYISKSSKLTAITHPGENGSGSVYPAMTGDGSKVIFASNGDSAGQNEDASMELFSYDTATQQTVQLTDTQDCYNVASSLTIGSPGISVSADGNRIAFQSNCDLGGQNPNQADALFVYERSSDTYAVLQGCTTCSGGFTLLDGLNISQDGNTVANYYGHYNGVVIETMMVHDLSHTTNTEVDFKNLQISGVGSQNPIYSSRYAAPSLSADGRRIAFTAEYDPVGNNADGGTEIFMLQRSGGQTETHQLTDARYGSGSPANSSGQVMDPSGRVVYLTSEGILWGKQSLGAFRVRLKAQK